MARWMGYGKQPYDIKINVHIAGRQGPDGIRRAYKLLSPEARNTLVIENEENTWGLDNCLTLSDLLPITLDIHHHWIRESEYIQPNDCRIQQIIDSWRGVRPTFHYSVSRENWLPEHSTDELPNMSKLLESGHKRQKLRAHSDFMWNTACNEWALSHLAWGDCMVESKGKNLSSFNLYKQWKNTF